jgi:hypothetical protein
MPLCRQSKEEYGFDRVAYFHSSIRYATQSFSLATVARRRPQLFTFARDYRMCCKHTGMIKAARGKLKM